MTDLITRAGRRLFLALRYGFGFVCWAFYMVWPSWRGGWWTKIGHAVLPFAGYYAYADDPWVRSCDEHWIKTGKPFTPEVTHGPF